MARRRRNPKTLNQLVTLGLLGGAGYLAWQNRQRISLALGLPTLANGTANPTTAPFKTDTGYSTSSYGSSGI
jgi:hypothetical protein